VVSLASDKRCKTDRYLDIEKFQALFTQGADKLYSEYAKVDSPIKGAIFNKIE